MAKVPIALELYSVRNEFTNDPRGTLKAVAEMGYDGVEFAGYANKTAEELKGWLDEFGLICCGTHTGLNLVDDEHFDATVAFNKTLGNPYVIIPGIPGHLIKTRADWQNMAKRFNDLSDKLAKHGLMTGYHNHHIEFQPLDGELPWDTFFGNTKKEVIMQLDTGNAYHGGAETLPILQKYPGRATTVHLKPYSKSQGFKPIIGEDDIPWGDVFSACETIGGTKWYIVEYESDAYPPLEACERCLKALRALGK